MPISILKSPSTSSASPRKRRISFNKRVKVLEIDHHQDFSAQELESYWNTPEDYAAIRDETDSTVDYYNRLESKAASVSSVDSSSLTKALDEASLCLRGLEHRTNSSKGLKAHLRRQAWKFVLDEQDIQFDLGSQDDSVILREVYRIYSLPASRIAQQKGWKDAVQAGITPTEAQPPMEVIIKSSPSQRDTALSPPTMRPRGGAQKNSIVSQAA
ncbi:unnamed protein product [Cylindrotheca closterium]|uniref:Uncharacterized protein n=1 Tax=Cylindrotheca closterium TaxID=2856 RepID=A0AAD2FWN4_9STRA|nr:unnamed protein product [Cylindrotheca closterium]